ncbi:MAG: extracellular solute-binding protein [Clostridia bacterium]|nr:extracellular solute-binding protein [Clostridia bacterium]
MKKACRLLSLLPVLCLCLVFLSSCHGARKHAAFEVPDGLEEGKTYEVVFWAKNDTNKTQTAIYQKAIADFEALYPDIRVNMRLYTDYGKIYNDVITNMQTGTTPHVAITYPDHIATYLTGKDAVVPLDGLMNDPRFGLGGSEVRFDSPRADEIVPSFLSECRIQEETYALPFMRSTEALYINKTYVEKLGYTLPEDYVTWDFVWEVSEAAMKKDPDGSFAVNGQKVMIPFIYKSTDNMMIQLLKQKNAGYSTGDGEILLFNDVTRSLLREIAGHAATGAFSTFKISSYPANFLNAGQCLFAVDSTAGATWMGSRAPLADISPDRFREFETAVYPVPQTDPENPVMISQGPSLCLFNKEDPGEVLAAWLFASYLLSNDVQIAYAETEGYVPVTEKAHADSGYRDYLAHEGSDDPRYYDVKLKASKLLLSHLDDTFVTPVFNGSTSLRDAAGQLVENTVKSVKRKETVDDAYFTKLFTDVTALYRLKSAGGGPLPAGSVVLLASLGGAWAAIGGVWVSGLIKKRKKERQN